MNQVIYGVHTAESKKQIHGREAKEIELLFHSLFPDESHGCSHFFKDGISKFWIKEVVNKAGTQYWLYVKVNFTRAIGIGEYGLMPYTISNMKKATKNISKLLKKLKLDDENADFNEWKLERVDTAFDIKVDEPEFYMNLLDKSLDVKALKKQCQREWFTPKNPNVCESIRFRNNSYTYNVYIKLADLINKGITITPEIHQEVANLIRVERQNYISAIKQLLPTMKVKDLALKKTMEDILRTLIADIDAFWSRGSYYSALEIERRFKGCLDVKKLIPNLIAFTKSSLEAERKLYTSEVRALFQEYGILPVGIQKEDEQKYQISEVKGLYDMVTDCYNITSKRVYHIFPVPHLCSDGRYKAGITFSLINDTRKQPVSITGRTIEQYEQNVWNELVKVFSSNVRYHCSNQAIPEVLKKSANDILRFSEVVESKNVKKSVKDYIKKMNLKSMVTD